MEPISDWLVRPANRRWAAALVIGIVLLTVYYPVFRFDYLYHDDWVHFNAGRGTDCRTSPMYRWSIVTGRPLDQYVLCGLFRAFDSVDHAWRARLINVGGIATFAFLQFLYFEALGLGWTTAVSLAIGASLLPGLLIFGYWITAGSIVFSLVASVAAVLLTDASIRPERSFAARAALLAGACALQVSALLIYQTQAMYFWTLTAVMLATHLPTGLRHALRPLAAYVLAGAAPTGAYFIWFRYLSGFAPVLEAADPQRGAVFQDPMGAAQWFLAAALPRASLLWFFDFPHGIGLAVQVAFLLSLVMIATRVWLIARRQRDRMATVLCSIYPLLIVCLGLLAFLPMLVTSFRLEVFRSLIPLSALLFLAGTIHSAMILRTDRWPPVIKRGVAAGFVLGVASLAGGSLLTRMVLPATAEYGFVQSSLFGAAQSGRVLDRVHAIVPNRTHDVRTDEIGQLTAEYLQDIQLMIQGVGAHGVLHPEHARLELLSDLAVRRLRRLGRRDPDSLEDSAEPVDPVMPECCVADVVSADPLKSFRIPVQFAEDYANFWRVERYFDHNIGPIELTPELLGSRRFSEHDCPRRRALVEPS